MFELQSIPAYSMSDSAAVLNELAADIYEWAKTKGFWEVPIPPVLSQEGEAYLARLRKTQKIMLVVTELAELVEGLRTAEGPSARILGFTYEEEELADAIIRLLDYSGAYGLRVGEALAAKMAHNEGRPWRHGKTF